MNFEPYNITLTLINDTKTTLQEQSFGEIPSSLLTQKEHFTLPKILSSIPESEPVFQTIEERQAIRHWGVQPVRKEDLLTILQTVYQGDAIDWESEHLEGLDIGFVVYVRNMANANPSIYRYCPIQHDLIMISKLDLTKMEHMVLQREFALAPVIVVITGKLGASICRYGSSGHRQLLVRGGMAAQRAWLSSIGLGYSGCMFAGIVQKYLYETARIDGYKEMQLIAYSFGNQMEI
ncbi:nitroreductase family protein [Brevibacillus laterosporus]|uniref:nitroreductase family protein n=1 Tax=Brevibacillus laterosporus TaxID=1465 RepID=UPI003D1D9F33